MFDLLKVLAFYHVYVNIFLIKWYLLLVFVNGGCICKFGSFQKGAFSLFDYFFFDCCHAAIFGPEGHLHIDDDLAGGHT